MGHKHRYGHGMGMMGGMGPMGMMGGMGPMGMMGPMRGMRGMGGMCPWCGSEFGGKEGYRKGSYSMTKHAKKKLLMKKLKERLERKYGDELNKLADDMISFAEERQKTKSDLLNKKMEMQQRMWDFLYGSEFGEEEEEEEGEGEGEE